MPITMSTAPLERPSMTARCSPDDLKRDSISTVTGNALILSRKFR